jgi:hypothetical protein
LLLATRQIARIPVQEPPDLQDLNDPGELDHTFLGFPLALPIAEVALNRQVWEEEGILKHDAHRAVLDRDRNAACRVAECAIPQPHSSLVGQNEAGNDRQDRGFPSAGRSEDHVETAVQLERNVKLKSAGKTMSALNCSSEAKNK